MTKKIIAVAVVMAMAIGVAWYVKGTRRQVITGLHGCDVENVEVKVSDAAMSGIVEQSQNVKVKLNWYRCNPIKRDDIVLYRYSTSREPVVRIVRAIPGDRFKLVQADDKSAWNIEINGALLKSKDAPFRFGSNSKPVLSIYENAHDGVLDQTTTLLFATQPGSEADSGVFGAISISDVIGKVSVD